MGVTYIKSPLSVALCQYYGYSALKALEYLHDSEIIHLDVHPGNFALGRHGRLKILDFGLSRRCRRGQDIKNDGSIHTTYNPPERSQSTRVSAATDAYCMGLTLFVMLLGKLPYEYY